MSYNLEHEKPDSNIIKLLSQISGIEKKSFTATEVHSHGSPVITINLNNKPVEFHFDDLHYKYVIVSCTENTIRIKEFYSADEIVVSQLVFENENTLWVSPEKYPTTRSYYIRLKN